MSEVVICHYLVRSGSEGEFARLLADHWPILRRLELVNDVPVRHLQRVDEHGRDGERGDVTEYVEIFEWVDAAAAAAAHRHPEVSLVWERMDALTTNMTFPHYRELTV